MNKYFITFILLALGTLILLLLRAITFSYFQKGYP